MSTKKVKTKKITTDVKLDFFKNIKFRIFIYSLLVCYPMSVMYRTETVDETEKFVVRFSDSFGMEKSFIMFLGVLFLMSFLVKFRPKEKEAFKISAILSAFISFWIVVGNSYALLQNWNYIFGSLSVFIAAVLSFVGYYIFFYHIISAFIYFIRIYDKTALYAPFEKIGEKYFKKNAKLKFFIIIFIGCLPYLIINFPGIIHGDSATMLSEYYKHNLSNHHPLMQTLFWGWTVSMGEKLFGEQTYGVFIYILFQVIYSCLIFSVVIDYFKRKGLPAFLWISLLIFMVVLPIFPRHIAVICKDHNYSAFALLFLYLMMRLFDKKQNIENKELMWIIPLWFASIVLTGLSRKSGMHVTIITLVFVLIYLRKYKRIFIPVLIASAMGVVFVEATEYVILNVFEIQNNNTKESLSLPFQQTARYVKEYGEDVTYEEEKIIDKILDYNNLGEIYNAERSTPVKETFKRESNGKDLVNYFKVWFIQFFKHPDSYLQAAFSMMDAYFYPTDVGYYRDFYFDTFIFNKEAIKEGFPKLEDMFLKRDMNSRNIPVIGLTSSVGFYVWLSFFTFLFFIFYKKDKKYMLYNIPALGTLLVCLLSPVNGTIRYALPIVYYVPFLLFMCFKNKYEGDL